MDNMWIYEKKNDGQQHPATQQVIKTAAPSIVLHRCGTTII